MSLYCSPHLDLNLQTTFKFIALGLSPLEIKTNLKFFTLIDEFSCRTLNLRENMSITSMIHAAHGGPEGGVSFISSTNFAMRAYNGSKESIWKGIIFHGNTN